MKGHKEHRVPLSPQAMEILENLPRDPGNDKVFFGATKNGLSEAAMLNVLSRLGYKEKTDVHGFRSAFKDWCKEQTNYPNEISELALAHTVGNAVERAYRRTDLFDKRRKLMAEWSKSVTTKPAAGGDNIVAIRSA
jgi:integrase